MKKNYNLMKCENTWPAIQRIAVKYYSFEEVPRGRPVVPRCSHHGSPADLYITHHIPRFALRRLLCTCRSARLHQWLTKNEGECFPLAGAAHVPAGVFKISSPPGRQINIWMIMIAVGCLGWWRRVAVPGKPPHQSAASPAVFTYKSVFICCSLRLDLLWSLALRQLYFKATNGLGVCTTVS